MTKPAVAFIGSGNMAAALIHGLVEDGYPSRHITAADPDEGKLAALSRLDPINTTTDNAAAVAASDIVVLSVKPQVAESVARELAPLLAERRLLVVSIAAGIRTTSLQRWFGGALPVVRAMPNTPAMVQTGATALFATPEVTDEQRSHAESLLRAVGLTLWLEDEDQLDAVTALSGSGPAYFFLVMEAMIKSAQALGLNHDEAQLLTLQTALGAARMAMESDDDPATLRARVTSPGGTTERAIGVFEQAGFVDLFESALKAARDRSVELSRTLDHS